MLEKNKGVSPRLLAVFSIATGLSVASCNYNQPLLGSIASEFGESLASAIAVLTNVGIILGLIFLIPLGDILQRKRLILLNYALSTFGLLVIALCPGAAIVLIASLIVGLSSVMPQFFIPIVSFYSEPENKIRNIGIVQSCLLVGVLGSRVFSGMLGGAFGWRMVFFAGSALAFACFVMVFKTLPDIPAVSKKTSYPKLIISLWEILKKYPYLRIASGRSAFAFASFFALWSCIAFKMKQAPFYASDGVIGWLGLCGLAGASSALFASGMIRKYGAKKSSVAGASIMAAAWLVEWLGGGGYFGIITGILLLDAGMQLTHMANLSSIVGLDLNSVNRVNTLYMIIYFSGGALGIFFAGIGWRVLQWTGVAAVGLAFLSLSLFVSLRSSD